MKQTEADALAAIRAAEAEAEERLQQELERHRALEAELLKAAEEAWQEVRVSCSWL